MGLRVDILRDRFLSNGTRHQSCVSFLPSNPSIESRNGFLLEGVPYYYYLCVERVVVILVVEVLRGTQTSTILPFVSYLRIVLLHKLWYKLLTILISPRNNEVAGILVGEPFWSISSSIIDNDVTILELY